MLDIITVPAITTLVYWVINFIKVMANKKESVMKLLPAIATFVGAVLGVIVYFIVPELVIAQNIVYAVIVGGASGLAATGTNQMIKQMTQTSVDSDKE